MPYVINLPNGDRVNIDDSVPPEEARRAIVTRFPEMFPNRPTGFVAGAKAGLHESLGALETTGSEFAKKAGFDSVADYLASAAQKRKAAAQEAIEPTTKEDIAAGFERGYGPGLAATARHYVTEPLGNMAGKYGPALAANAIPYVGTAASLSALTGIETGDNIDRQREQGGDVNLLNATASGLVQGAIDRFGLGKFVSGAAGQGLALKEAARIAPKVLTGEITKEAGEKMLGSTLRNVAVETGANAALGTGMMVSNEALRRGQAGQEMFSPEAMDTYKESAIGAAALSPIFGGIHGAGAKSGARRALGEAETKGAIQRQQIRDEQVAGVAESWRAEEQARAEQAMAAQKAKEAAAQEELARIPDAARRATETRDQPGVLDPQHPLEMIQPPQGMRTDARIAFRQPEESPLTEEQLAVRSKQQAGHLLTPEEMGVAKTTLDQQSQARNPLPENLSERATPEPQPVAAASEPRLPPGVEQVPPWEDRRISSQGLPPEGERRGIVTPQEQAHAPTQIGPAVTHGIRPDQGAANEIRHVPEPIVADARPSISAMGLRSQQEAIPQERPVIDGGRNAGAGEPAGAPVSGTGRVERPLDIAELPQQKKEDIFWTAQKNDLLGAAVQQGDFTKVASALSESRNPIIQHLGALSSKLEGVKVAVSDTADTFSTRDRGIHEAQSLLELREAFRQAMVDLDKHQRAGFPESITQKAMPAAGKMFGHDDMRLGTVLADMGVTDKRQLAQKLGELNNIIRAQGEKAVASRAAMKPEGVQHTQGQYDPATKTVVVHPDRIYDEHTVGHEMAHALLHTAIDTPTPVQAPLIQQLSALYSHVKKALGNEKAYGLENLHEFAAESFTNPKFQKRLSEIPYGNQNAWGRFTHMVARLLGFKKNDNNALTEFLAQTEALGKTGLKAEAKKGASPLKLGDYSESSALESEKGKVEGAVDAVKSLFTKTPHMPDKDGLVKKMSEAFYKAEQKIFDIKVGVTRLLGNERIRTVNGRIEATARSLLQGMEYSSQFAREAIAMGGFEKNAEGWFEVKPSNHNFGALHDAIMALPVKEGQNRERIFNGILTNLTYAEREATMAREKVRAANMLKEGRILMKDAKKLPEGYDMEKATQAKTMIDEANDLLAKVKEYKRPASVTDKTMAEAFHDAQTPEVRKMLDIVHGINLQDITTLEQGGRISKEIAGQWRENKFYVPLQRAMEEDPYAQPFVSRNNKIRDLKTFKGSEREVDNILDNMVRQKMYVVDAALRNNAYAKALHEMQDAGVGGVERFDKHPKGKSNVVTVRENGKEAFYTVDDPMAFETFQGIHYTPNAVLDAAEKVTNFFREMVMLSPDAVFRNFARDQMEAWAFGNTNKALTKTLAGSVDQFLKSIPGIAKEAVTGKVHQPRYDVSLVAGITGVREYTSLMRERREIINDFLRNGHGTSWAASTDNALRGALHAVLAVSNEVELTTRNKVYQNVLERTGSKTEAALAAINTLDFRRRGSWDGITAAKKMIPFFNSNLQGVYKLYRALARNDNVGMDKASARKVLIAQGMKMALAASAYSAVMMDDPDYKEVSKNIADQNILVPVGDGQFLKIALPFEFGSAFWTVPANIVRHLSGDINNREMIDALKQAVVHNTPSVMPQIVKPGVENAANYSFFRGRPLESDTQQQMLPAERFNEGTSEVAKTAGAATGTSPIMIDNLLRGYFGSIGTFVTGMVDKLLESENTPATPLHKEPIMRSLLTDPLTTRSTERYYQMRDVVNEVYTTANRMAQDGRKQEALEYLQKEGPTGVDNRRLYNMHKGFSSLDRQLANIRREERNITNSNISSEMKRAQLDYLKGRRNDLIKEALPQVQKGMGEGGGQ